uniref:Interleukin 17C n=1 Tax=Scophthalmus maximus TaxID=52904 RepID=A0A8D3DH42_SCOMX
WDIKEVVLILALVLAPAWTCKMHRCFSERELQDAAEKRLRSHYPQPAEPSAAAASASASSPASCPVELYRHQPPQQVSDRSASPWRYVLRTNKDHFPSTYAEAQCLCSGCILVQGNNPPTESHDYVSVPIRQSRVFLRRELCSDGEQYHLKPVTVDVVVGCTCARYRPRAS